jgi:hypothetical protein
LSAKPSAILETSLLNIGAKSVVTKC